MAQCHNLDTIRRKRQPEHSRLLKVAVVAHGFCAFRTHIDSNEVAIDTRSNHAAEIHRFGGKSTLVIKTNENRTPFLTGWIYLGIDISIHIVEHGRELIFITERNAILSPKHLLLLVDFVEHRSLSLIVTCGIIAGIGP